jgi:hypothetical protein
LSFSTSQLHNFTTSLQRVAVAFCLRRFHEGTEGTITINESGKGKGKGKGKQFDKKGKEKKSGGFFGKKGEEKGGGFFGKR